MNVYPRNPMKMFLWCQLIGFSTVLFAGESMFHRRTDASKVALVHLVARLRSRGAVLLDVQWTSS